MNKLVELSGASSVGELDLDKQRLIVKEINEFLFCSYDGIGDTVVDGIANSYFSDYHKYWSTNFTEILGLEIDEHQCEIVADILHEVFVTSKSKAFTDLGGRYTNYPDIPLEEICRIRFLTANQDFGKSLKFDEMVAQYRKNSKTFDCNYMFENPGAFLDRLGIKSQTDKRSAFVQKIAKYVIDLKCTPYQIIKHYNGDVLAFKNDLTSGNGKGAGYGSKKTNMFIRDMYVSGIWTDISNFDKIDVASDINTIKVALRTGILKSKIPLVSSFLDIFSYQYSSVDALNEKAWRKVWELWSQKYPAECVSSPSLIDFFIYDVIGRQFCKNDVTLKECNDCGNHQFGTNKKCKKCGSNNLSKSSCDPCLTPYGDLFIETTPFFKNKICDPNLTKCPFLKVCKTRDSRDLNPPKSISIKGLTGWESAYTKKGKGGGGLMS